MRIEAPTLAPALYSVTPSAQASSGRQAPRTPSTGAPARPPTATPAAPHTASTADGDRRARKGGRGGGSSNRGGSTGRGGSQGWPSFYNPWTDTISMWLAQAPNASRPPASALLTTPPYGTPPPPAYGMPPYGGPRPLRPCLSSRLRGPLPRHPGPRSLEAGTQPLSLSPTALWRWLHHPLTRSSTPVQPTTPPPPQACYLAHTHPLPHTLP